MQIDYMREFLTLAETLSFAETSRRLYITQSALSRHISSIEDELNTKLFIREPRVALTMQGSIFANSAKRVLHEFDQGIKEVADSIKGVRRVLRIGYLYDAMRDSLPLVSDALKERARVDVSFSAMEYGSLSASLSHEYVDVALTLGIGIATQKEYEAVTIGFDRYYVVVPFSHPFAEKESVSVTELQHEPFITPNLDEMGADLRSLFMHVATNNGAYSLNEVSQYSDIPSLAYQVESGEGISLMFGHHRKRYEQSIAFVPIEGLSVEIPLCIVWQKDAASPGATWPNVLRNLKKVDTKK